MPAIWVQIQTNVITNAPTVKSDYVTFDLTKGGGEGGAQGISHKQGFHLNIFY